MAAGDGPGAYNCAPRGEGYREGKVFLAWLVGYHLCVRQMLSVGRVLWAVVGDGGCVVSEL